MGIFVYSGLLSIFPLGVSDPENISHSILERGTPKQGPALQTDNPAFHFEDKPAAFQAPHLFCIPRGVHIRLIEHGDQDPYQDDAG